MEAIKPPGANVVFKAPVDWDEAKYGPCRDVHVVREDGVFPLLYKPDMKELETLVDGGYIMLSIVGNNLPPHSLAACTVNGE